MLKVVRDNAKS